ncbi:hypothetical protein [Marinobacter salarius]|jgi:Ca2+/Na+ antiporter|uniref:hypothetical protein n=1 Tax=Marinobacter salarius TaxID=1420917 RepID=UPI0010AA7FAF|nr:MULTISPECIES: hypothetical protein [Marinobacter]MBJ7302499.1 hypothetical protein [Marinobacter salarius]HIO30749.1 hypothetical protein [Marinobacter salarius]HIP01752.1 hypothetical protein [Marinobacter salarius]
MKSLKVAAVVLAICIITVLLGAVLDSALGDTGKMLYGAACFVIGFWVIPWATSEDRRWMP